MSGSGRRRVYSDANNKLTDMRRESDLLKSAPSRSGGRAGALEMNLLSAVRATRAAKAAL
jgi:hypothetical protein